MDIIKVVQVGKKYKDFQAVKNLSFSVKKGEIFGLLGPNGAGKTTTIKILTTQIRPDEGSAYVLDYDITKNSGKIKEKIGIVFEDQNFYPRLTVLQNLNFFAGLYGKSHCNIMKVLDYVKLKNRKNEEAQKLSRGLKQRLLIARALLPDPDIIFLDEPTVGLDPHVARDIRQIFKELKNQGKTIFLTTHYMEEADEMCNRVAFINEGKIVKMDTPENLKEHLGPSSIVITITDSNKAYTYPSNSKEGARFLNKLIHENIPFNIKNKSVSLEDVFMHLTGSKLEQKRK